MTEYSPIFDLMEPLSNRNFFDDLNMTGTTQALFVPCPGSLNPELI